MPRERARSAAAWEGKGVGIRNVGEESRDGKVYTANVRPVQRLRRLEPKVEA